VIDDGDSLEIGGRRVLGAGRASCRAESTPADSSSKRFLSVWFRCCHAYGRMQRNREGSAYEGRCPKCGSAVRASIGPGGTSKRMFEAS
jgi:hypothetical protein